MKFGKAFGAVAALKQEGLALRHAAELARQLARFTREDERRIVCELAFGGRERIGVAIGGQLARLVRTPAMRLPIFRHLPVFFVRILRPMARMPARSHVSGIGEPENKHYRDISAPMLFFRARN